MGLEGRYTRKPGLGHVFNVLEPLSGNCHLCLHVDHLPCTKPLSMHQRIPCFWTHILNNRHQSYLPTFLRGVRTSRPSTCDNPTVQHSFRWLFTILTLTLCFSSCDPKSYGKDGWPDLQQDINDSSGFFKGCNHFAVKVPWWRLLPCTFAANVSGKPFKAWCHLNWNSHAFTSSIQWMCASAVSFFHATSSIKARTTCCRYYYNLRRRLIVCPGFKQWS